MPRGRPKAIFVQLATSCNAECVSCPHRFTYGREGHHEKGAMSDEVWRELLDQVAGAHYCGQIGLYLHHEPLTVTSLERKIREVNERTTAFAILSTNAALLDDERSRSVIDARPRKVHLNICSAEREQYNTLMPGLDYDTTFTNAHRFIDAARGKVGVVINCPVIDGVDVGKLRLAFPGVRVDDQYWANSRGGLVSRASAKGHASRFRLAPYCIQPLINFNVLWDGGVIVCCQDWAQESKQDFPTIMKQNLFEIYGDALMSQIRDEFRAGNYNRYRMCGKCAAEMGFTQ